MEKKKRLYLKFPSPYGVSFILIYSITFFSNKIQLIEFPSPYGVSFILIHNSILLLLSLLVLFPSPYGVSFILIYYRLSQSCNLWRLWVSVSLRSIIHSYIMDILVEELQFIYKFPSPYGVSFILIDYFSSISYYK